MNTQSNLLFAVQMHNEEDYHVEFRVYQDGSQAVNTWCYDDDTAGAGADQTVEQYLDETHDFLFVRLARKEYDRFRFEAVSVKEVEREVWRAEKLASQYVAA